MPRPPIEGRRQRFHKPGAAGHFGTARTAAKQRVMNA
jgi:hypothetical protein